jgi:hypothetical protein
MPGEREPAGTAASLRRAVAPVLDLPYPDPEAVELAALAERIATQTTSSAAGALRQGDVTGPGRS